MPLTKDLRWSNIDLVFRESHICSLVVTYLERHFSSGLMKTWSVLVFLIYALEFFFIEINLDFYSIKQYSEILCLIYLTPIQSGLMREKTYCSLFWHLLIRESFTWISNQLFFVNMQYICTIRWSFIGLRK